MKECTFMRIVKQKGSIKYVQDCGICLNTCSQNGANWNIGDGGSGNILGGCSILSQYGTNTVSRFGRR